MIAQPHQRIRENSESGSSRSQTMNDLNHCTVFVKKCARETCGQQETFGMDFI